MANEPSRRSHFKELWEQRVHIWIWGGILASYTALGFIRDDLLPYGVDHHWWGRSVLSHLTVLDFLGEFSWRSWLAVAALVSLGALFEAGFRLDRNRQNRIASLMPANALKLVFDPDDERCVAPGKSRYGSPSMDYYSVLVQNHSGKSISNVSVRALPSWFTSTILAEVFAGHSVRHDTQIVIREIERLDPGATDVIALVGISYAPQSATPEHVLNNVQTFTLEGRAEDTKTVYLNLDYDPDARPMLRAGQ